MPDLTHFQLWRDRQTQDLNDLWELRMALMKTVLIVTAARFHPDYAMPLCSPNSLAGATVTLCRVEPRRNPWAILAGKQ